MSPDREKNKTNPPKPPKNHKQTKPTQPNKQNPNTTKPPPPNPDKLRVYIELYLLFGTTSGKTICLSVNSWKVFLYWQSEFAFVCVLYTF